MDRNAFTADVRPGGLTEGLEIKILICYLLHHIHRGMSFAEINEVFRSKGIANYFEYSQEISRLLHSGHIVSKKEIDGVERFYITDLGIKTSTMFYKDNQDAPEGTIEMVPGTYAVYFPWDVHIPAIQTGDVPAAIRETTLKAAQDYYLRQRIERDNEVRVEQVSDGYNITLRITDIGSDLMSLTLFVPKESDCDQIREHFYNDPAFLYRGIIAMLTGDEDTVRDILDHTRS